MSIGSSPLARGLRGPTRGSTAARGIIPARAGFTVVVTPAMSPLSDHPRSRGVYTRSPARRRIGPGSSPLARGLLASPFRARDWAGIIPARAGFTCSRRWGRWSNRDHPRSRGVYSI